jgi:metal-responsive CopG/Arc/MetJ family transcriptional regulator
VAKINISLSDELLAHIDAEAKALEVSRSGLIQEASVRYIVAVRGDREAEVRRLRIAEAARRAKELGTRMGLTGDIDTVRLVHEVRDDRDGELELSTGGE